MIRIFVVDDHPIVREGLIGILEDQIDFDVVGSAGSAEEALAIIGELKPDVILLDLEMSGMDGVTAIPKLLAAYSETHILVFTAYDTDDCVFGAIKAGAKGYLLKGTTGAEITRAIQIVHAGGSALDPRVASKVLREIGTPQRSDSPLSGREQEVLALVARGLSNKQIAHDLSITERTVKFHVSSLFTKLDADNRAQVVAVAMQRGLLN